MNGTMNGIMKRMICGIFDDCYSLIYQSLRISTETCHSGVLYEDIFCQVGLYTCYIHVHMCNVSLLHFMRLLKSMGIACAPKSIVSCESI